jgi:hypothetical protein
LASAFLFGNGASMMGFLRNLAARSLAQMPVMEPRRAGLFEDALPQGSEPQEESTMTFAPVHDPNKISVPEARRDSQQARPHLVPRHDETVMPSSKSHEASPERHEKQSNPLKTPDENPQPLLIAPKESKTDFLKPHGQEKAKPGDETPALSYQPSAVRILESRVERERVEQSAPEIRPLLIPSKGAALAPLPVPKAFGKEDRNSNPITQAPVPIQVSIGRIEIRANVSATPSPRKSQEPSTSSKLDEYLQQRRGRLA